MKTKTMIVTIVFMCIISSPVKSQTVMFGGNAQHTGISDVTFPTKGTFVQLWKFKTSGRIFASAVTYNKTIYFGSDDSCLYALNTKGELRWKFKTSAKIRSTPAIGNNVLYINNYKGILYAVNSQTGKELWRFKTEGDLPRTGCGLNYCTPKDSIMEDLWDFYTSSPTIDKDILYFGSGYSMYAINTKSGTMIWQFKASGVIHSTPAVNNGKVFFGCWNGKLYAVNATDGKECWSYQTGFDKENHSLEGIQSSPTVYDSTVVIGVRDSHVYALNLTNGKLIWKQQFSSTWMPSSFAYDGEKLYTGSSDIAKFLILDKINGKTINAVNTGTFTFSTPALAKNIAFIGSANGALYAIDIANGTIIDEFQTDGRKSNPYKVISANGSLNNNAFADLNSTHYSIAVKYVERLFTAGSILSTPVIYKKSVYFGSTDGNFYGVEIKSKTEHNNIVNGD
jgi:outer membrane protein assembly factor BamB